MLKRLRHWWSPPDYRALGLLDGQLGLPSIEPMLTLARGRRYGRRYETAFIESRLRTLGCPRTAAVLRVAHKVFAP
jgi:hypothetical protein